MIKRIVFVSCLLLSTLNTSAAFAEPPKQVGKTCPEEFAGGIKTSIDSIYVNKKPSDDKVMYYLMCFDTGSSFIWKLAGECRYNLKFLRLSKISVCESISKKPVVIKSEAQSGSTSDSDSADKYASTGCKTFPSAIVRLQNASGAGYGQALIAAQEASFNMSWAGRLDSKYQVLSNAQFIIVQYAQAVGWGGRGYSGDVNVVRTALATFNSGCNSNLSLK